MRLNDHKLRLSPTISQQPNTTKNNEIISTFDVDYEYVNIFVVYFMGCNSYRGFCLDSVVNNVWGPTFF